MAKERNMERDNLSKIEQFKLLTETAPGTPMGKLLRKFWHPIALVDDLPRGKAQALRILSEDLTLYRGQSGRPYLIGGRCAHRCTVLHTGVIQGEQIRCMYHGWRYDGTGLCTDIPAEKQSRTRPIKIAGYPLHEYCGVIFAYLGNEPIPTFDLPRKHVLEDAGRSFIPYRSVWDCNWFQQVENSLDALHVSFAHLWGSVGEFGSSVTHRSPTCRTRKHWPAYGKWRLGQTTMSGSATGHFPTIITSWRRRRSKAIPGFISAPGPRPWTTPARCAS
jgi:5,5'-dehydrodivanillate O-demethylase